MKATLFIKILLLTTLTFFSCKNKKENSSIELTKETTTELVKIEISYVNLFIKTFGDISCMQFSNYFKDSKKMKRLEIDNQNEFTSLFNEALFKKKKRKSIDSRIKMRLYYSDGVVKTICVGIMSFETEGQIYSIDKKFRDFLIEITDSSSSGNR